MAVRAISTSAALQQAVPAVAAASKKSFLASLFGATGKRVDVPLTDALPGVVIPDAVPAPTQAPATQLTKLSNGFTVASEDTPVSRAWGGLLAACLARWKTRGKHGLKGSPPPCSCRAPPPLWASTSTPAASTRLPPTLVRLQLLQQLAICGGGRGGWTRRGTASSSQAGPQHAAAHRRKCAAPARALLPHAREPAARSPSADALAHRCGASSLPAGVSHLLEYMAFKTTKNRTHLRLVREVEAIGGNVLASGARQQGAAGGGQQAGAGYSGSWRAAMRNAAMRMQQAAGVYQSSPQQEAAGWKHQQRSPLLHAGWPVPQSCWSPAAAWHAHAGCCSAPSAVGTFGSWRATVGNAADSSSGG